MAQCGFQRNAIITKRFTTQKSTPNFFYFNAHTLPSYPNAKHIPYEGEVDLI